MFAIYNFYSVTVICLHYEQINDTDSVCHHYFSRLM